MLGAIEAGGTKFVCAISENGIDIIDQKTFPTTTPDETIAQVIGSFKAHPADRIGLASFGPIDVNGKSDQYGYITKTLKPDGSFLTFSVPYRNIFLTPSLPSPPMSMPQHMANSRPAPAKA